jgi:membrane protein implicated in regulation of membrane protease activity
MHRSDKWWAWAGLALLCFLALPLQTDFGWIIKAVVILFLIAAGLRIAQTINRKLDEQVDLKRRVEMLERKVASLQDEVQQGRGGAEA